jgi:glycosyltransferase involved in cell wall biosynthesis
MGKKNRAAREFSEKRKASYANKKSENVKPIETTKRKIKLLYHGDSPKVMTGFGRVSHEVLSRLHATGKYEIHSVGINDKGDPNRFPEIAEINHYALPDYQNDPYGVHKLPEVLRHVQPDVIFTLNDIWVIDGSDKMGSKNWFLAMLKQHAPHTPWVFYFPVDSRPWKIDWANLAFSADKPIVYSKYAIDVLKELNPGFDPIFISHGVTLERFNIISDEDRKKTRTMLGCSDDTFLIGFVSRNQPRKNLGAMIEIFKMANEGYRKCKTCEAIRNLDDPKCEYCGESNEVSPQIPAPLEGKAKCYLHCNLFDNMGIDGAKVINDNKAGMGMIFNPGHSIPYGLPSEQFNQIFNCLDVHLLPTMAEGYGLSLIEGMACGVPTIATRTTAVTEILEGGGGIPVIPRSHYVFDDAANTRKHIIDYERAIHALTLIYQDWKNRGASRWGPEGKIRVDKGLAFAQEFTWDKAAKEFDFHIQDAINKRVRLIDQYTTKPGTKVLFQKADNAGGILQTMPAVARFTSAYPEAEVAYAMPSNLIPLFKNRVPGVDKLIPFERMSDKNPNNIQNIKVGIVNFNGPEERYERGAYPFVDRSRPEIYCLHANVNPNDVTLRGMWAPTEEESRIGAEVFAKQVPNRGDDDFVVGFSPLTSFRSKAWGEDLENWNKLKKYVEKIGMKVFMLDSGADLTHNLAALKMCNLVVTVDGDIMDFLHAMDVACVVLLSPYWRVRIKGWDNAKIVCKDDLAQRGLRDDLLNPQHPSQFIDQIGVGEVFTPILTYNKLWKQAKIDAEENARRQQVALTAGDVPVGAE